MFAWRWSCNKYTDARPRQAEGFRASDTDTVIEMLVRSGLWCTLSHAERSILPVLATFTDGDTGLVEISYRGLMRYSGVGIRIASFIPAKRSPEGVTGAPTRLPY